MKSTSRNEQSRPGLATMAPASPSNKTTRIRKKPAGKPPAAKAARKMKSPSGTGKVVSRSLQAREDRLLWMTAVHEAGHALVSSVLDLGMQRVSIVPGSDSLGHVLGARPSSGQISVMESGSYLWTSEQAAAEQRWHDNVVSLLAGMAAERLLAPNRFVKRHGASDLQSAHGILSALHPDNEIPLVFKWLEARAKNLVSRRYHPGMIRDLAAALVCVRKMSGEDAEAVLRWSRDRQDPDLKGLSPGGKFGRSALPAGLVWTGSGFAKAASPAGEEPAT